MRLNVPSIKPNMKFLLICDFDGTISASSTLSILASIGYARNPNARPWSEIVSSYSHDLKRHNESYRKPRTSIHDELAFQDSLRPVERASIERIEAAGVFQNVKPADLAHGAASAVQQGRIRMRPGWDRLVGRVRRTGGSVEVISVNWSGVFIRAAINAAFPSVASHSDADLVVAANDIDEDCSGRFTRPFGYPDGGIWTAGDKVHLVQRALEQGMRTVYVGDSVTDLGVLTAPNVVGIALRDETAPSSEQRELKETLDRLGTIQVRHVSDWKADEWSAACSPQVLSWAQNFEEIFQCPLFASG